MLSLSRIAVLGAAVALLAAPAHAALYSASFSGTAATTTGTPITVGSTVNGAFLYSSDSNRFLSFTIDGFSTTGLATSAVTTVPSGVVNPYEALYRTATSASQTGGNTNTAFALDLLSFNAFTGSDALPILLNPGQLETQANSFDGNFSSFSYTSGSANTTTVNLDVALDPASLQTSVAAVPEPASLALLAVPMLALAVRRRG